MYSTPVRQNRMLRRILRHKVENDNLIVLMIISIWKFIALYSTMSYDMCCACWVYTYVTLQCTDFMYTWFYWLWSEINSYMAAETTRSSGSGMRNLRSATRTISAVRGNGDACSRDSVVPLTWEAPLPVYHPPLRRRRQNIQTIVFAECLRWCISDERRMRQPGAKRMGTALRNLSTQCKKKWVILGGSEYSKPLALAYGRASQYRQ